MMQNHDSYTIRYTNCGNPFIYGTFMGNATAWDETTCARRDSNAQPSDPKSETVAELVRENLASRLNSDNPAVQKAHDGHPNNARSIHESLHESRVFGTPASQCLGVA